MLYFRDIPYGPDTDWNYWFGTVTKGAKTGKGKKFFKRSILNYLMTKRNQIVSRCIDILKEQHDFLSSHFTNLTFLDDQRFEECFIPICYEFFGPFHIKIVQSIIRSEVHSTTVTTDLSEMLSHKNVAVHIQK